MNEYSDLGQLLRIIRLSNAELAAEMSASFGDDTIKVRTEEAARFYGLEGDDTAIGGAGDDQFGGGDGDDRLSGRDGDDLVLGGRGNDTLLGGEGNDTLIGNEGDDKLVGGAGRDFIQGEEGDDRINGGAGNDRLSAGEGHNVVNGGAGNDALVLDGMLADYRFSELSGGRTLVVAKDGSSRTVVSEVEIFRAGSEKVEVGHTTTLQLLHASDLEGNASAVANAPNFATVIEALEAEFETTLIISSGDNYIPSPFSNGAGTSDPAIQENLNAVLNDVMSRVTGETYESLTSEPGRFDIAIMNAIGFDASAVGNHEFDFGQQQVFDIVAADTNGTARTEDDAWTGALFPYLSANLTFEDESVLAPIVDADGVGAGEDGAGVIAPFAILEENGELFGVIGATTPLLETISSTFGDPNNPNDEVHAEPGFNDMAALAAIIQPIIDAMQAEGINKIILTSHLQQIALEQELAGLLDGVDIIIAGGSDTRLADGTDRLREGDEAQGNYPLLTKDAGGNDVAIVSTDGQYSYVGRLVAEFDAGGNLLPESIDAAVSGAYATDEQGVLDVTGAPDLETAIANSVKGSQVRDLVNVVEATALEVSGKNFFADQAVDLNGEREPGVRTEETNLGNLTADANLDYANDLVDEPVYVSLKNGGGIRASIPLGDGMISELEIQEVLAFNNTLSLITLTPAQLLEVLNYGVEASEYDENGNPLNAEGRFPQVSGVRFSFDPAADGGARVQDVWVEGIGAGGTDVKIVEDGVLTDAADALSGGIRVVTLSFLVAGGDGYPYQSFVDADPDFANVVDLFQPDVIADGFAQFTNVGTEQDALAEYLAANFGVDSDPSNDFADVDTLPALDLRIMNLAVPGVTDFDM
ncbi:5'-nucleotidase C-terminal domain-containing protein [Acuticoccus kandeliae]|uniref:5'-nucleotidase C-terminal domain-containing protein n=1 Tax=Acuticoccus kandeliae TaxID=2073160 RepID=UPI000D3EB2F6|nr:5'-nucleotidase C-terminal domain-containing protein [Acuticoccus kandeliae]